MPTPSEPRGASPGSTASLPHPICRITPAFTLLELLLSIAIVSTLLTLLLPALRGGRDAARASLCASNVRQLSLANSLYAGDYRDRCAPGAPNFAANLTRWHGSRQHPSGAFHAEGGTLSDYFESTDGSGGAGGVRVCPAFTAALRAIDDAAAQGAPAGFERSCGGYGYNNVFVGVTRRRAVTASPPGRNAVTWPLMTDALGAARSMFRSPAATVEFADAALASTEGPTGVIEYSFLEPRFWPEYPDRDPSPRADPSIHFRHGCSRGGRGGGGGGGAVAAMLDGHVGPPLPMSDSWTSGIYGVDPVIAGIGWFSLQPARGNGEFDPD
ncbi:MAG: type II secretion system protein [Phycisphaerales bacterium]